MKYLISLLIILSVGLSCKKSSQNTPIIASKNYLRPSHELQKSNITIDLVSLRNSFGFTRGFILAVGYLDINQDGYDDIFINAGTGDNNRTNCEMYIYKNGSYVYDNSFFNTPSSLIHARKALVGDYNGDKKPDVFVTGHGYDQPPFPGEYVQLLMSNSSGQYDLKGFDSKIGFYHGACSGDIDNDRDLDIFVLGGNVSYFLINDGKGNFSISTDQIDINQLGGQYHCELLDIDKDGYLDLIIGGHEMDLGNTTKIFWGNSSYRFNVSNKTDLPTVDNYGVITDLDIADLDSDGKNEIIVTRTGGKWINNILNYFYKGWYIQIIKLNGRSAVDKTTELIELNSKDYLSNNNWITWVRVEDYDNNGKLDLFSTKCGGESFVRWELQNNRLIRIN